MDWYAAVPSIVWILANMNALFMYHGVTDQQKLRYVKTQLLTTALNVVALFYLIVVQLSPEDFNAPRNNPSWQTLLFTPLYILAAFAIYASFRRYKQYRPRSHDEGKRMAGIKVNQ